MSLKPKSKASRSPGPEDFSKARSAAMQREYSQSRRASQLIAPCSTQHREGASKVVRTTRSQPKAIPCAGSAITFHPAPHKARPQSLAHIKAAYHLPPWRKPGPLFSTLFPLFRPTHPQNTITPPLQLSQTTVNHGQQPSLIIPQRVESGSIFQSNQLSVLDRIQTLFQHGSTALESDPGRDHSR